MEREEAKLTSLLDAGETKRLCGVKNESAGVCAKGEREGGGKGKRGMGQSEVLEVGLRKAFFRGEKGGLFRSPIARRFIGSHQEGRIPRNS